MCVFTIVLAQQFLRSLGRHFVDLSSIGIPLSGRTDARYCSMPKRFVYLLRSVRMPERHYVGLTSDVSRRVAAHNAGESSHTSKYSPWVVSVVVAFDDEARAVAFERYLKSGSGAAFLRRHLL